MAVIGFAQEVGKARGVHGQNNERQYYRTFRVLTDSKYDGPRTVLAAPLLPAPYSQYSTANEDDPGARVIRREPRMDEKLPLCWFVDVEYSSTYNRKDDNPFIQDPEINYGFEFYREPLPGKANQDYSYGDGINVDPFKGGIINSAGDTYDPPAERDAARPTISFARNEATFNSLLAIRFINSVNNAQWNGLQPRQAMLRGLSASFQRWKSNSFEVADILYWKVTYTFVLKRETWDLQLLDIGPNYLVGGVRTHFTNDSDGSPRLGLLDGAGAANGAGADPKFNRFRVYKEESFDLLNINLGALGV